jgi:transposase-like protein
MPKKRYNAEEIIHKLRGADVLLGQGKTVSQACKQIGVSDQTYYRWRLPRSGTRYALAEQSSAANHATAPAATPTLAKGRKGKE